MICKLIIFRLIYYTYLDIFIFNFIYKQSRIRRLRGKWERAGVALRPMAASIEIIHRHRRPRGPREWRLGKVSRGYVLRGTFLPHRRRCVGLVNIRRACPDALLVLAKVGLPLFLFFILSAFAVSISICMYTHVLVE